MSYLLTVVKRSSLGEIIVSDVVSGTAICEVLDLVESGATFEDLLKSCHSLAKGNHGFWKSEKQGMYLLHMASQVASFGKNSHHQKEAERWASHFHPVGGLVVASEMQNISFAGHKDPTKIRYIVWHLALDEAGVLAIAKAKVKHYTGKDPNAPDANQIIPGSEETTFHRGDKAPQIQVDYFGTKSRAEKAQQDRVAKNKPLIDKLSSHPDFRSSDFLQSIVRQLEGGDELSPKQRMAIEKYTQEKADLSDLGTPEQWLHGLNRIKHAIKTKIGPLFAEVTLEYEEKLQAEYEKHQKEHPGGYWGKRKPQLDKDYKGEAVKWAAHVADTGTADAPNLFSMDWSSLLHDVFAKTWYGINITDYWFAEFIPQVTKAIKNKGQKLSKKSIPYIMAIDKLADALDKVNKSDVERA